MNETRNARIEIQSLGPAVWRDLGIRTATGWKESTEVYSYLESVQSCTLERKTIQTVEDKILAQASNAFEGRLFDGTYEARWVSLRDGRFRAWVIRESDDENAMTVRAIARRYYLIGTYRTTNGQTTCSEARYPGRHFEYPISHAPDDKDRAFIEVVEYAPVMPSLWSSSSEEVQQILNQPPIINHRFVRVGVGKG